MLARTFRTLRVTTVADAALLARPLLPADNLQDALRQDALAICPALALTIQPADRNDHQGLALSVDGHDETIHLGWTGGRGGIDTNPLPGGQTAGDVLGAATAACLAAAAVTLLVNDQPVRPRALNLVEMRSDVDVGTTTLAGPVAVGTVVVAGAGAVTQALQYWLAEIGVRGSWTIVDADAAELHNTNRCLCMTAADAGWPDGRHTRTARSKSDIAAASTAAQSRPVWFDEYLREDPPRPDLLLVLANERNVRHDASRLGHALLLAATTSTNWTAELHRFRADRDDCPHCRFPPAETDGPSLLCSTGPANPTVPSIQTDTSRDAALPFLSAAAGLVLVVALLQMTQASEPTLLTDRPNHWRIHLDLPEVLLKKSIWSGTSCRHHQAIQVRAAIQRRRPGRWDFLDR